MAYELESLTDTSDRSANAPAPLRWTNDELRQRIDRLLNIDAPRLRRLWAYYRNPMQPRPVPPDESGSDRPYRQAQEWGLPSRITGARSGSSEVFVTQPVDGVARKEVVIENDIGWRIDTMVDYLFGKPIVVSSAAPDPQRRELISLLLRQVIAANGGIKFLQELALLGSVYGFVDVLVKLLPEDEASATPMLNLVEGSFIASPASPSGGEGGAASGS